MGRLARTWLQSEWRGGSGMRTLPLHPTAPLLYPFIPRSLKETYLLKITTHHLRHPTNVEAAVERTWHIYDSLLLLFFMTLKPSVE